MSENWQKALSSSKEEYLSSDFDNIVSYVKKMKNKSSLKNQPNSIDRTCKYDSDCKASCTHGCININQDIEESVKCEKNFYCVCQNGQCVKKLNTEENLETKGDDKSDKNSCLTVENFDLVKNFILEAGVFHDQIFSFAIPDKSIDKIRISMIQINSNQWVEVIKKNSQILVLKHFLGHEEDITSNLDDCLEINHFCNLVFERYLFAKYNFYYPKNYSVE